MTEIAMFTDQVDAAASFYEAIVQRAPSYRADGIAIFELGDVRLLIHAIHVEEPGHPPCEDHVAFPAADLDALCDALVAEGVELELAPKRYPWGRSAYLRDPDGRLVELEATDGGRDEP